MFAISGGIRRAATHRAIAPLCLCALVAAAVPGLSQASTVLHVFTEVDTNGGTSQQGGTTSASAALGGGTASAAAGFGVLKIAATSVGAGDNIAVDTHAQATFSDSVTMHGAPDGTLGTMVLSAGVFGSLTYSNNCPSAISGTPTCFAVWSFGMTAGGPSSINEGGRVDNVHGATGNPFATYSNTFSFTYGVPFTLSEVLLGEAYDDGEAASSTGLDMSHSVYWGGISNVTANGQPLATFSVTSDSGTDWSQSLIPAAGPTAPEPATLWTFGGVFIATGWLKFRRRLT
jgi:hypothetical protein